MCLGENIRFLRTKKGYSQDDIANKLGYKSFTTIQKWESGVSEPPLKALKKLSEIFNIDMNDLATKSFLQIQVVTMTCTTLMMMPEIWLSLCMRILNTKFSLTLLARLRKKISTLLSR